MYYINYFFFYSIIGHIFETIIYFFCKGESGILFCPWTPIYGFGSIIVIYFYNLLKTKNKILNGVIVFLIGFILLTFLEFIGGVLIEKIFGIVFWSYEDLKYNFGNYISLEVSIIWSIASLLIIKMLKYTDKIIKKIPRFISWFLIILMIIDVLLTCFFK